MSGKIYDDSVGFILTLLRKEYSFHQEDARHRPHMERRPETSNQCVGVSAI